MSLQSRAEDAVMFSFCSGDHCFGLIPREALSTTLKETQYLLLLAPSCLLIPTESRLMPHILVAVILLV